MWRNNMQTTGHNSRSPMKSIQSVSNLSPFSANSLITSAKNSDALPSGVRYVRQTPDSIYRSVSSRSTSPAVRKRDKSPTKSLRFAEPLSCSKSHSKSVDKNVDKTDGKTNTVTKPKSVSTHKSRLNLPVITPDSTESKKKCQKTNDKTVAISPATRQTSPIFSVVDFGGDSKKVVNNKETKSSATKGFKQSSASTIKAGKQSFGSTAKDSKHTSGWTAKSVKQTTDETDGDHKSPTERKTTIKSEISGPNGTVKRSSVVTPKGLTNGAIHRNAVTFPIIQSSDKKEDQKRLSVNVNIAVGIDCNEDQLKESMDNRFVGQKLINRLSEESNYDEIDWTPTEELEGSAIKVAVRLRPFSQMEMDSQNDISVIDMNGSTVRIINTDNDNYNRMEFGFDECLNSSDRDLFEFADQDRVFHRTGEPLLEWALEGYNVCLFAYGQTGSGKTYTMMGTDTNPGVIPRFVHELYKRFSYFSDVLFSLDVSYCEIYNEKIYDLLSDDKNNNKKILRIREHPITGPFVENLSEHAVKDEEDVMELLMFGNRRRATASTGANDYSSRSHSIFTIVLSQLRNSGEMGLDMSCSCKSRINLIDLAGSERVGGSGTSGERLKEGSLINKSLLNLGKVISKLADLSSHPSGHIPYRDSALTYLLKDSLGGNSRTSMIATISPAKCHLEETLSTLRYASTARRIVNYVHINEDVKSRKIRELLKEIAILKSQQMDGQTINWDKKTIITKSTADLGLSKEEVIESKTKSIETFSKATNTSFMTNRRTSTKGTDTSFSHKEKKTCSIATNTSFITKPKTCSTGTEPLVIVKPKPMTVSTATEMSFIETTETSTETIFRSLPTPMDLLRTQQLEEQQKQLLEAIKRQRRLLLGEEEESGDKSDPNSDYYECEEQLEDIPEATEHTANTNEEWGAEIEGTDVKQKSYNISIGNTEPSDWGTDEIDDNEDNWDTNQTQEKATDDWVDDSAQYEENGAEDNVEEQKDDNYDNDWTQEVEEKSDSNKEDTNWGTETETDDKTKVESKEEVNDWCEDQTQDETNLSTDNTIPQESWSEEQNWAYDSTQYEDNNKDKSDEKQEEWTDWGTGDTADKSEDTNKTEDNNNGNEDFDWGSDNTNTTVIDNKPKEDDEWGTGGQSDWGTGGEAKAGTGGTAAEDEDNWD